MKIRQHWCFLLGLLLTSFSIFCFELYYSYRGWLSHASSRATVTHKSCDLSQKPNLNSILAQRRQELEGKGFCVKLLRSEALDLKRIKAVLKTQKWTTLEKRDREETNQLIQLAEADCSEFKTKRGYFTVPTSTEERDFSIAFSILMYKHVSQVERLLRAIYSPSNYYCIHVDHKATLFIHEAMQAIASCLPNVFVVPKPEKVKWGEISILDAERKCMRKLVRHSGRWRYFINLTGEEFPLWSNRQLVRILKAYNGTNDVNSLPFSRSYRYRYVWRNGKETKQLKEPPPKELTIHTGEVHIVVTRGFVELAVNGKNPLADKFFRWTRDVLIPDEFYYATLNFNAQALKTPGGLPNHLVQMKNTSISSSYNARFKIWRGTSYKCAGRWQRDVCVIGVGDLRHLPTVPQLFINKFDITYDPIAFDCAEFLQLNRTVASAAHSFTFDTTRYSNMPTVRARKYSKF